MKVGIIGTGGMGKARAEVLLGMTDATISWICSRSKTRAGEFLTELQKAAPLQEGKIAGITAAADWRDAMSRDDAEAVIICTPNTSHYEQGKTALQRGKHVLIEYPHSVGVGEGEELLSLSRQKELVFHVGLTHRCSDSHKKLAALLSGSSPLGQPQAYQRMICSGNPISRWYNRDNLSGGMFTASLYHHLDEVISYLGKVDDITAHYYHSRDSEHVILRDCASVMLVFESGCTASITYARGFPKPGLGSDCSVICEKGYIKIISGCIKKYTPEGEETIHTESQNTVFLDTQDFIEQVMPESPRNAASRSGELTDHTGMQAQYTLSVVEEACSQLTESSQ